MRLRCQSSLSEQIKIALVLRTSRRVDLKTEVAEIAKVTATIVIHMTHMMTKNAEAAVADEAGVAVIANAVTDVTEAETATIWMPPLINFLVQENLSDNPQCRSKTYSPRGIKSQRSPQPLQAACLSIQARLQSSRLRKAKRFSSHPLLKILQSN